jgi:hypothetical protein
MSQTEPVIKNAFQEYGTANDDCRMANNCDPISGTNSRARY